MGSITRTGLRATAVDFSEPYFVSSVGVISRNLTLEQISILDSTLIYMLQ